MHMFDQKLSISQKRAIITLLIQLAEEDNDLSVQEALYINEAARHLGLTERDIDGLSIQGQPLPLDVPMSEKDRMSMLYFFLFLSSADGKVGEKEVRFCQYMGIKLGFNPQMTEKLLTVIEDNLHRQLDPEKMIAVIQAYLN